MEYQILMGHEAFQKWESQMKDFFEQEKWRKANPINDQPKQLWHIGSGIYIVLFSFGPFSAGDNILLQSYIHDRIVILATPTTKQRFIQRTKDLHANMRFTPHEWKNFRLPTKKELWDLIPHLSSRIEAFQGIRQYMKFYPEYLCESCFKKKKLDKQRPAEYVGYKRTCGSCGLNTLTMPSSSLKPIKIKWQ